MSLILKDSGIGAQASEARLFVSRPMSAYNFFEDSYAIWQSFLPNDLAAVALADVIVLIQRRLEKLTAPTADGVDVLPGC